MNPKAKGVDVGLARTVNRILTVATIVNVIVVGCGFEPPVKPPPPVIETIGVLAGLAEFDGRVRYSLADGRQWDRPKDQFRILYDMPGRDTLFVAGADSVGAYVLLVGSQDGLPVDCRYALRYGGTDWGDSIASQGLLWPKADTFVPLPDGPGSGSDYPSNAAFCLDDRGSVTSVYLAVPPEDEDSAPVPSATG